MKANTEEELFVDIGDNVQRLNSMLDEWVEGKRKLKEEHKNELDEFERGMLAFLWRCRKLLSTSTLSRKVGMSRQTLYEKWERYGFDINDV
jgi:DNA-binding NtrC family response regulator